MFKGLRTRFKVIIGSKKTLRDLGFRQKEKNRLEILRKNTRN